MRPWVKLWTDIATDYDFLDLSPDAKLTFLMCLAIAGRCNNNGMLQSSKGIVNPRHIALSTGLATARQVPVLDLLVRRRFLTRVKGVLGISNWMRYQAPLDENATERQKRYRHRRPQEFNHEAELRTLVVTWLRSGDLTCNGSTCLAAAEEVRLENSYADIVAEFADFTLIVELKNRMMRLPDVAQLIGYGDRYASVHHTRPLCALVGTSTDLDPNHALCAGVDVFLASGAGIQRLATNRSATVTLTLSQRALNELRRYVNPVTAKTKDVDTDAEKEPAALTAPPFPDDLDQAVFPDEPQNLRRMAEAFLRAFGGCKTDEAIRRHTHTYTNVLATFRSRGASPRLAWDCFTQCWLADNGKPLFAARAKSAISYLPPPPKRRDNVVTFRRGTAKDLA
jgi:hypothetical protein